MLKVKHSIKSTTLSAGLPLCIVAVMTAQGEMLQPDGGGEWNPEPSPAFSETERASIQHSLQNTIDSLETAGTIAPRAVMRKTMVTGFAWPVACEPAPGQYEPFVVTQFVDHDTTSQSHCMTCSHSPVEMIPVMALPSQDYGHQNSEC